MKHSRTFLSILFSAVAICYLCLQAAISPTIDLAVMAARAIKRVALRALPLFVAKNDDKGAVVVAFIQAKEFVLRIIKRERPVVSTEWRMCPST